MRKLFQKNHKTISNFIIFATFFAFLHPAFASTEANSNKTDKNSASIVISAHETYSNEFIRTKNTEEFMKKVTKKIKGNWKPKGFDTSLEAVVHFKILDDGTVENPIIEKSSGNKDFDNLSIKTISELEKIEPLPKDLIEQGRKDVEIKFTFDFNYHTGKKPF